MSNPERKEIICGKIKQLIDNNEEALNDSLKHILKHLKMKGVDL